MPYGLRLRLRISLTASADVTAYAPDAPPPTLLFSDGDLFVAPRLAAFLDAAWGAHVAFHAQARADRGFDPGEARHGDGTCFAVMISTARSPVTRGGNSNGAVPHTMSKRWCCRAVWSSGGSWVMVVKSWLSCV